MTSKYFYAISLAAIAAAASGIARAGEADASQYQIEGSRTRAEVMAEAAQVARTRSTEPAGSRIAAPLQSSVDPQAIRAEAIQSVRLGQTSRGEI